MREGQTEIPEGLPAGGSSVFNNKTRLLIVGMVVVLALGYLIYAAFPGNTLYYLTVDEFLSDESNLDGRSFRVVGTLVPGTLEWMQGEEPHANFVLAYHGQELGATYHGAVLPDLFDNPHSEIVLEGYYGQGDVFHTDTVIVKCPSKYQARVEDA